LARFPIQKRDEGIREMKAVIDAIAAEMIQEKEQ
tara:strand:- start:301 stop:402 length:102 start_codon:yes stop_codon:yes gene_type:complete